MTKLLWDQVGTRLVEAGVDRGVLYPRTKIGVSWSGLVSVDESPLGGETTPIYLDGVKYLDVVASEDYKATIAAFSAPEDFNPCDGNVSLAPGLIATQQPRARFGFSYRTLIGNDTDGMAYGYKLHLVYNCIASPTSRANKTLSTTADPTDLSWEINSVPPQATGYKPTAHFVVDSTKADPTALANLETLLYGNDLADDLEINAQLPTQETVIATLLGS